MKRILEAIKEMILESTENVELIFVYGSYAFNKMQKYSDIDVSVATRTKPHKKRTFHFIEHNERKTLVTIHFYQLQDILKEIERKEEWVWVYMAYRHAKVLFDRDHNMEKIKTKLEKHKVTNKDFLDIIPREASYLLEYIGKLKNAYLEKDELNIFFAARTIAELCYNILKPFNPVWKYTSEKETYTSFIELKKKPEHYVDDFKICYGLTMERRTIAKIYKSAMRLAEETTTLVRKEVEKSVKDKEFLRFFNSEEYKDFLLPKS